MAFKDYIPLVADAKLTTPTVGLTTDNVDWESPSNLSGQDSIRFCNGYEDGFGRK